MFRWTIRIRKTVWLKCGMTRARRALFAPKQPEDKFPNWQAQAIALDSEAERIRMQILCSTLV